MENQEALRAIDDLFLERELPRPLDSYSFGRILSTIRYWFGLDGPENALPAEVLRLFPPPYEQIAVVFLDAFGQAIFDAVRKRAPKEVEPFAEACYRTRLTTLFPSTTAVHVTAFHTGMSPAESGILEWHYYEDRIGEVITPLPFTFLEKPHTGDTGPVSLSAAGWSIDDLLSGNTFAERLAQGGIATRVFQPEAHLRSPFTSGICRGAAIVPISSWSRGLHQLADALAEGNGPPKYVTLYEDSVDHAAHAHGPASQAVTNAVVHVLRSIREVLFPALARVRRRTLFMMIADHGQVECAPEQIRYLDRLDPSVVHLLATTRSGRPIAPAGSVRDLFLYPQPRREAELFARVSALVGDIAEVRWTRELADEGFFGAHVSERFRRNAGPILVLPRAGSGVYWAGEHGQFEVRHRGHHGGLTRAEQETILWLREFP